MNRDVMGGLGIGLLIGLAIGLLYAPREGRETREMLRERAEEVREKTTEAYEKARKTAADVVKKGEERFMHPKAA